MECICQVAVWWMGLRLPRGSSMSFRCTAYQRGFTGSTEIIIQYEMHNSCTWIFIFYCILFLLHFWSVKQKNLHIFNVPNYCLHKVLCRSQRATWFIVDYLQTELFFFLLRWRMLDIVWPFFPWSYPQLCTSFNITTQPYSCYIKRILHLGVSFLTSDLTACFHFP